MKKILSLVLAAVLLLGCSVTFAEGGDDTGIQMIGGPEDDAAGTVNLDDWKVGETVEIPNIANITLAQVDFKDYLGVLYDSDYFDSGEQAEYLYICVRVLNTKKTAFNFLPSFGDVICNFGDGYQFGGWKRQEHLSNGKWYRYEKADEYHEIGPLYSCDFCIVVTLPNYVVESKEPLSVTFTIGESEFTVNVRK